MERAVLKSGVPEIKFGSWLLYVSAINFIGQIISIVTDR